MPVVISPQEYCLHSLPLRLFLSPVLPPFLPFALSPHPRSLSTLPSQQYSSPLVCACVLAFMYPRERVCVLCVCVHRCESSEDSGEPSACLVCTQNRSHWGASTPKTTMVFFFNTWYYAIVLYDSLVSEGASWGRKKKKAALNSAPSSLHGQDANDVHQL